MDEAHSQYLRRGSWLYPQPVAIAAGRILRSRSDQERLDAVLRCGEILARYLAALSLASFAARDADDEAALTLLKTKGELSFGDFLSIIQHVSRASADHPLKPYLVPGFAREKTGGRGTADDALIALLELRNQLGHQLDRLSGAQATAIHRERNPLGILHKALRVMEGILGLPLVLVEEQRVEDEGAIVGRILWLMGESADPEPIEVAVEVSSPFRRNRSLYVGVRDGALSLWPMLLWDIADETKNYRLFFVDAIREKELTYKTVEVSVLGRNDQLIDRLQGLFRGDRVPLERARLAAGRDFLGAWLGERKRIEAAREQYEGRIPWEAFDPESLDWFARRLSQEGDEDQRQRIVTASLLDGRERLAREEIDQLVLLFGFEGEVRRRLGRDLIDLRVVTNPGSRWDERATSAHNILESLRTAVDLLGRHIGVEGVTLDGLTATAGSADYIAIREALVNLFIHQDYSDRSAAAQIELAPERALFFNTGRSLVSADALIQGGKSQSRNPLVARALRLIGFADLAGSGLRELQKAWRSVKRRPPKMVSDKAANTFTLSLDWREVPDTYDKFWKDRLGVQLTEKEAVILSLAGDPGGINNEEAASATGLDLSDAEAALRKLERQVLVEKQSGRFCVKEHLRELVEQAGKASEA